MPAEIVHLNPEGLHSNPAYTQAVSVAGSVKIVYVGGQNAVDEQGKIVGAGDIKAQTIQALRNVEVAVAAAGGSLEQVVKWTVYLVEGQSLQLGFEGFLEVWGRRANPPAITGLIVSGLARPEFLVEIDATAAIPAQ